MVVDLELIGVIFRVIFCPARVREKEGSRELIGLTSCAAAYVYDSLDPEALKGHLEAFFHAIFDENFRLVQGELQECLAVARGDGVDGMRHPAQE